MSEKVKSKRKPARNNGCRGCLFLLLGVPFSCFVIMFIFARIGGEWAVSGTIEPPNNSQLIASDYSIYSVTLDHENDYHLKSTLYIHPASDFELFEWFFNEAHSKFLTFWNYSTDLRPDFNSINLDYYQENNYYYIHPSGEAITLATNLYYLSLLTTNYSRSGNYARSCNRIIIFQSNDLSETQFADYDIPDGFTPFIIQVCWPKIH